MLLVPILQLFGIWFEISGFYCCISTGVLLYCCLSSRLFLQDIVSVHFTKLHYTRPWPLLWQIWSCVCAHRASHSIQWQQEMYLLNMSAIDVVVRWRYPCVIVESLSQFAFWPKLLMYAQHHFKLSQWLKNFFFVFTIEKKLKREEEHSENLTMLLADVLLSLFFFPLTIVYLISSKKGMCLQSSSLCALWFQAEPSNLIVKL